MRSDLYAFVYQTDRQKFLSNCNRPVDQFAVVLPDKVKVNLTPVHPVKAYR